MVAALISKNMKVYGNLQKEARRIRLSLKACEAQISITYNIHHSRINYGGEAG